MFLKYIGNCFIYFRCNIRFQLLYIQYAWWCNSIMNSFIFLIYLTDINSLDLVFLFDLSNTIYLVIKLFGERDTFPFYIKCLPYLESNIPSKIFYASISYDFLRIVRTATDLNNLATPVNLLLWMHSYHFIISDICCQIY